MKKKHERSRGQVDAKLAAAEFRKIDGVWFRRLPRGDWKRAHVEHGAKPGRTGRPTRPTSGMAITPSRTVWK